MYSIETIRDAVYLKGRVDTLNHRHKFPFTVLPFCEGIDAWMDDEGRRHRAVFAMSVPVPDPALFTEIDPPRRKSDYPGKVIKASRSFHNVYGSVPEGALGVISNHNRGETYAIFTLLPTLDCFIPMGGLSYQDGHFVFCHSSNEESLHVLTDAQIRQMLSTAYARGFSKSGEGYNAEFPFEGGFEGDVGRYNVCTCM